MTLPFDGRLILVVEDEMLIALTITDILEQNGARTIMCGSRARAEVLVETDGLSAAVLDHGLTDGHSLPLCERLTERDIPFVIYTGYSDLPKGCHGGAHLMKPATDRALVETVTKLFRSG